MSDSARQTVDLLDTVEAIMARPKCRICGRPGGRYQDDYGLVCHECEIERSTCRNCNGQGCWDPQECGA